jgi:hypothetical protein
MGSPSDSISVAADSYVVFMNALLCCGRRDPFDRLPPRLGVKPTAPPLLFYHVEQNMSNMLISGDFHLYFWLFAVT